MVRADRHCRGNAAGESRGINGAVPQFRETPEQIWPSLSPGVSQQRFRQDADVDYEVVEATPNRRLVTKIADKNLPYGGSWIYEIEPEAAGSILRITERGEVLQSFFPIHFPLRHGAYRNHRQQPA